MRQPINKTGSSRTAGTLWLTQAILTELYDKAKATISEQVTKILEEGELDQYSVVRLFRTTAAHGKPMKFNNITCISLQIAEVVRLSVAEYSINPQEIENKIKLSLLPLLFTTLAFIKRRQLLQML